MDFIHILIKLEAKEVAEGLYVKRTENKQEYLQNISKESEHHADIAQGINNCRQDMSII